MGIGKLSYEGGVGKMSSNRYGIGKMVGGMEDNQKQRMNQIKAFDGLEKAMKK